jgi:outer membrane protein assembly factor BamB
VPDTGQTQSYTSSFGEDHDYTINAPSYTKLNASGAALPDNATTWAMVMDNVTGLIWENKTDDGTVHDKDNLYTFATAQSDFIATLNGASFGNRSDWRMPTVKELATIVNNGRSGPAISTSFFENTLAQGFLTSQQVPSTTNSRVVNFNDTYIVSYDVTSPFGARAVCGGTAETAAADRFSAAGDGTVYDLDTGLMWQQGSAPGTYTWEQALAYCESLNAAGYSDWRLPTWKEYVSIVDYSRMTQTIYTSAFPGLLGEYHWSSTTQTSSASGTRAAIVNYYSGAVFEEVKTDLHYALPVRTGFWSANLQYRILSSPAVAADGTIYVGENSQKLHAFTPEGRQKWSFAATSNIDAAPAVAADGTVYAGSLDGNLYAVTPGGTAAWAAPFATGGDINSSPAIAYDGTIYVGSNDGKLYAVNPNGSKKWEFPTGGAVVSSPAIAGDGTVYVGSADAKLYAVNPNGTAKWASAFIAGGAIESSPAIGRDGTIYVGSNDHKLYAVNPDGSKKWEFPTGGVLHASPAIAADGTIYIGSYDHKLYAVNPDGTAQWATPFDAGAALYSSPAVAADGTVYVGAWSGVLHAVNADGTAKSAFKTGSAAILTSPAIGADGTVYVGTDGNKLFAVNAHCGGPAASAWPMFHGDSLRRGRFIACTGSTDCDDGLYCNGQETCAQEQCIAGSAPCAAGQSCNENSDQCISAATCIDTDNDGYGEGCSAGPDCADNDSFYASTCPDCQVKIVPRALGLLPGDGERTRRLLVIGPMGTVFDENTVVSWESPAITFESLHVFFKRFMVMRVTLDEADLTPGTYRALIGTCSGQLTVKRLFK